MDKSDQLPCFIDFEASSLDPGSYPIEVAWTDEHGRIESYLINPYAIGGWLDWDPMSQAVHGLSRNYLSQNGKHPQEVAGIMNEKLSGKVLYCDGGEFDNDWCDALFTAVGLKPTFTLDEVQRLWYEQLPIEYMQADKAGKIHLDYLKEKARLDCGKPAHRAGNDVAYLVELWQLIMSLQE